MPTTYDIAIVDEDGWTYRSRENIDFQTCVETQDEYYKWVVGAKDNYKYEIVITHHWRIECQK